MATLVEHARASAFLERAGPWLLEREDHHNLILDFAQGVEGGEGGTGAGGAGEGRSSEALFATVEEQVGVCG